MAKDGDIKNSHVSYELAADPLIHVSQPSDLVKRVQSILILLLF